MAYRDSLRAQVEAAREERAAEALAEEFRRDARRPQPAPRAQPAPQRVPLVDPRAEALREDAERQAELDVTMGPTMRQADAARAEQARLRAAQREAEAAREQIVGRERERDARRRREDEEIKAAERDAAAAAAEYARAYRPAPAPNPAPNPPAIAQLPPPPAGNLNQAAAAAAAALPPWRDLPFAGAGEGTGARQAVIDAQRPYFQRAGIDINATPQLTASQILDELFRANPSGRVGGMTRAQMDAAQALGFKRSGPSAKATKALERATAHLPRYSNKILFGEGRPMTGSGVAAHLVKGSEEAKAHMANLRKMRGQKRGLSA